MNKRMWQNHELKKNYDVVIIGGGAHGLATAYYLSKLGIKNVAVLEQKFIGYGGSGRNTALLRSNYRTEEGIKFYDQSIKLYEDLSSELDFNLMFSQRGHFTLGHSTAAMSGLVTRAENNKALGVNSYVLEPHEIKKMIPEIDISDHPRFRIHGALYHPPGGIIRHDAVVWAYARGADSMGVDIIQNCEVKGIKRKGDAVEGIETTKGFIQTSKIGVVAAGHSSVLANMAGIRLPLESKPLQALVSEPIKPIIDTVVMSNAVHAYVSQSDKGELVIGAGTDAYISYTQKGTHEVIEGTLKAILELYPIFSRLRMLRQWGGVVDICPDASPIISKTSVKGLYFNCGWGTGGFKATPGSGNLFAYTIANDEPHKLNAAFDINRFVSGDLVDEHGAAAVAH